MSIPDVSARLSRLRKALPSHPAVFAIGAAIVSALWFNGALWRYLASQLDLPSPFALASGLAVALIPITLNLMLFMALAVFSNRLLKTLLIALSLGNAVALYFIDQYEVFLDRTMMGNVLNTDTAEAGALLHPQLLLYLCFWAGIPAWLVWIWPLRRVRLRERVLALVLAPGLCLGTLYALSFTWLWITEHDSRLGARILPWSYVINTVRFVQTEKRGQQQFDPLPDATPATLGERKRVVVLVIGESARADRQSMLGYTRDTNAQTRAVNAVAIPGVQACSSYTLAALTCILSHKGDTTPDRAQMGEPLPSYLYRQGIDVIWRSANSGEPPLKVRLYERLGDMAAYCPEAPCEAPRWDGSLLHGLSGLIAQSPHRRIFIVLHLSGSHGPAYHTKYPPDFERFKPTCKTVILKDCEAQSLANAYDNSIAYTDHVLASLSNILGKLDAASAWLYLSDHGESLGEGGLYLHGMPRTLSPREQLDIPFSLWFSSAFAQEVPVDTGKAAALRGVGQGHVFHTVMGMLALSGGPYRPELDLLKLLK
ncbi:MAG: DUF1705 domain-containing protein [Betaproteobacteria bacterium]|nr:DUF1705 domain-containing protein [Betaproteobacteria bacterium]